MTKQEFIDRVADQTNLSKRDATEAVEAVLGDHQEHAQIGGEISFTGFGKFHVAERGPAPGRQPADEGAHHDPGRQGAAVHGRLGAQGGSQERLTRPVYAAPRVGEGAARARAAGCRAGGRAAGA